MEYIVIDELGDLDSEKEAKLLSVLPLPDKIIPVENEDICSGCGNLYCEVLGCNPKIVALSCGCAPSYCCCDSADREAIKKEETDGT